MSTIPPLESARRLRELIVANRDATERDRRLPEPIVSALVESKLCRLALPAEEGGLELPPLEACEVYEELAAAEASVAWIAWNNSLVCWFARHMPEAVRREVFGDPGYLYASSTRPTGRAVVEGDGYVVSGSWSLVSGCLHADWLAVLSVVEADGEVQMLAPGTPQLCMALVPRERFEIADTWHAGGLRGTGSHDVSLAGERVPAERTFAPFFDPSRFDSAFGRVPIVVTIASGGASIALGIARAAADALVELGRSKGAADGGPALRDRPAMQSVVARSAAVLDALRGELRSRYARVWAAAEAGEAPAPEAIADVWSAAVTAAVESRNAVTQAYAAAGASSLYTSSPIERAHRDVHAVLQHIALQPFWLEQAGRVRLGLEPTNPLFAV